jgi:hypothetical protein
MLSLDIKSQFSIFAENALKDGIISDSEPESRKDKRPRAIPTLKLGPIH